MRDEERIALGQGGKISQLALFLKTVGMVVRVLPHTPSAQPSEKYTDGNFTSII